MENARKALHTLAYRIFKNIATAVPIPANPAPIPRVGSPQAVSFQSFFVIVLVYILVIFFYIIVYAHIVGTDAHIVGTDAHIMGT